MRELLAARLAYAQDGTMTMSLPVKDEWLIIPNTIGASSPDVTAMTRRDEILGSVVLWVVVDMVNDECALDRCHSGHPCHRFPAPVASMIAGSDSFVQVEPVFANASVSVAQRMVNPFEISVEIGHVTLLPTRIIA